MWALKQQTLPYVLLPPTRGGVVPTSSAPINVPIVGCKPQNTAAAQWSLPEQMQVVLLNMWQRQQRGVVQPAALDQHLHQVTDADGWSKPAFSGSYIQHGLRRTTKSDQVELDLISRRDGSSSSLLPSEV